MNRRKKACLCFVGFCAVGASTLPTWNAAAEETVSRPSNYAEIKALFESHSLGTDYDPLQRAPMKELRAKGDEATAALIILFKEAPNDRCRANIVNALVSSEAKNKKVSADLLAQQLPAKTEDWRAWWIVETIRFLTAVDPEAALDMSRKGLTAGRPEIQLTSVKSLTTIGTADDLPRLDLFLEWWQKLQRSDDKLYDPKKDKVSMVVTEAKEQISKRVSQKRPN